MKEPTPEALERTFRVVESYIDYLRKKPPEAVREAYQPALDELAQTGYISLETSKEVAGKLILELLRPEK